MKVILINGSPHKNGCTYTALKEVADTLEKRHIETDILYLGQKPIAGCIACGKCDEEGICTFDDHVNIIIQKMNQYQGIVIVSPVYYGGPTGQICSFMERLCYAGGKKLEGMIGASIVTCRRGGATAAFDRLNKYFQMNNVHLAGSQYWNMVHGTNPEEAKKDLEGLQTMRTLGENMAWLLQSIEAGKNDVKSPEYENKYYTNFIME